MHIVLTTRVIQRYFLFCFLLFFSYTKNVFKFCLKKTSSSLSSSFVSFRFLSFFSNGENFIYIFLKNKKVKDFLFYFFQSMETKKYWKYSIALNENMFVVLRVFVFFSYILYFFSFFKFKLIVNNPSSCVKYTHTGLKITNLLSKGWGNCFVFCFTLKIFQKKNIFLSLVFLVGKFLRIQIS